MEKVTLQRTVNLFSGSRIPCPGSRGLCIAEFALVLPFVILLILIVIETAFIGLRVLTVRHAASRAARVAEVYQKEFIAGEINANLPPSLFLGGLIDNKISDAIDIKTLARPFIHIKALEPAFVICRNSPKKFALPNGLSNEILQGGDTPSPYCLKGEGYETCGFPE